MIFNYTDASWGNFSQTTPSTTCPSLLCLAGPRDAATAHLSALLGLQNAPQAYWKPRPISPTSQIITPGFSKKTTLEGVPLKILHQESFKRPPGAAAQAAEVSFEAWPKTSAILKLSKIFAFRLPLKSLGGLRSAVFEDLPLKLVYIYICSWLECLSKQKSGALSHYFWLWCAKSYALAATKKTRSYLNQHSCDSCRGRHTTKDCRNGQKERLMLSVTGLARPTMQATTANKS